MPRRWFRGLNAATRDRYPALLSYAAMLTPDLDEARELTDDALIRVLGSARPPRTDLLVEAAVHEQIVRSYIDRHASDAAGSSARGAHVGGLAVTPSNGNYAPPQSSGDDGHRDAGSNETQKTAASTDDGIGVATASSSLAIALLSLTAAERVAALSWWIDGATAEEIADRLDCSQYSAVDALHRSGIALAAASGGPAPDRNHYSGARDVVTVEVRAAGQS